VVATSISPRRIQVSRWRLRVSRNFLCPCWGLSSRRGPFFLPPGKPAQETQRETLGLLTVSQAIADWGASVRSTHHNHILPSNMWFEYIALESPASPTKTTSNFSTIPKLYRLSTTYILVRLHSLPGTWSHLRGRERSPACRSEGLAEWLPSYIAYLKRIKKQEGAPGSAVDSGPRTYTHHPFPLWLFEHFTNKACWIRCHLLRPRCWVRIRSNLFGDHAHWRPDLHLGWGLPPTPLTEPRWGNLDPRPLISLSVHCHESGPTLEHSSHCCLQHCLAHLSPMSTYWRPHSIRPQSPLTIPWYGLGLSSLTTYFEYKTCISKKLFPMFLNRNYGINKQQ